MDLLILTTGGSMDKTYSTRESAFVVDRPAARRILDDAGVTLDVEIRELLRKDSLDITDEDRELIAGEIVSASCDRIVITHGTDTIVETARYLGPIRDRTVVLTGAMRPADFRRTDAEFNLGAAVTAAQILPAGIYLVMNGQVLDPATTRKNFEKDTLEEG
jgi:L-asparaginase